METNGATYDDRKVGRLMAWIGDHWVCEYGTDHVIKFSKLDFFMGFEKARAKALKDRDVCRTFFGDYVLATEVLVSSRGDRVALVQPKISGHYLGVEDMQRENIRRQFAEIYESHRALVSSGVADVDLIGSKGFFDNSLTNIFVTPDDRLVIFDAMILEPRDFGLLRPVMAVLSWILIWRQKRVLRYFNTQFNTFTTQHEN